MPDILIRDVPDDVAKALEHRAKEAGYANRSAWLVEQMKWLAAQPAIKGVYSIRCYGENGAFVQIARTRHDTTLRTGARNCNQKQFDAYKKAQEYVQRNELGDREKALLLLGDVFEEVFEQ